MKIRNKTKRNQKGFISTKVLAASGFALTAALTGSFVYSSLGATTVIGDGLSSGSGDVCVSAHWADDFSVNSRTGNCEGIDTSLPGDESNEEAGSNVIISHSCQNFEINITQDMYDHSEKNKEFLGYPEKMTPYPDGGWNIIYDYSKENPSFSGFAFTMDGLLDSSLSNAHNSAGVAVIIEDDKICSAFKTINGSSHSDDGPSQVTHYKESGDIGFVWTKNGKPYYRDGDLPHDIRETKEGQRVSEAYYDLDYESIRAHRISGPALTNWDSNKNKTREEWYLNGVLISTKDAWIEAGGLPSAWID